MIFGMLNPEKIRHENTTHLSTSPVRCKHFAFVEKWLFSISQGKVAIPDRWGGQICKRLCQIFLGFNVPKTIEIG